MTRDTIGARYAAAREDHGLVVIEGFHAVKHCLRFGGQPRDLITDDITAIDALVTSHAPELRGVIMQAVTVVAKDLLGKLVPRAPSSRLIAIAPAQRASATE